MKGNRWSEEEDARLRKMHGAGVSYNKIAAELGRTKNQVSGRVKRLGMADASRTPIIRLSAEEKARRKAGREQKAAAAKKRPPKPVLVRRGRPSDLIWTPRTCQFPLGSPKEPGFHFCGAKLEPADGRPYCPEHHQRCYLPPKRKEGDGPAAEFQLHAWKGRAA